MIRNFVYTGMTLGFERLIQRYTTKTHSNLWTSHIISHLLDNIFRKELYNIFIQLENDKLYACYISLFKGSNYLSLGPQFLVTNHPDMDQILKYLMQQYNNLAAHYNITDTNATLVRIRELDQKDQQKFDQFFFEQMDTDPLRRPHSASAPILDGLFFPYIDLLKEINHKHALLLHEDVGKVIFLWNKFDNWFIVDFDRIQRKGVAYNKERNITFEDSYIDNYIVREAMGFKIIFDPLEERVLSYSYQFKSEKLIKPVLADNPLANDIAKRGFLDFLKNVKNITPEKAMKKNIEEYITKLTPPHEIGVLDCETVHDIDHMGNIRKLQRLNLAAVGGYMVDKNNNPLYIQRLNEFPMNDTQRNAQMVVDVINFFIHHGVKKIYVHNWAGFDSVLLMKYLVDHWKTEPFVFDKKMVAVRLFPIDVEKTTNMDPILTIFDSIKLLPIPQDKLTKGFQVDTLKGHFPHYFDPTSYTKDGSINYVGDIPAYSFFEPKRTSIKDYNNIVEQLQGKPWDYVHYLSDYLRDDCVSLHQVMVKFANETYNLTGLDPTNSLSIPGLAFRMWRSYIAPSIFKSENAIYDLNKNISDLIRPAYFGGHVDVYIPYIEGNWYSYDVNSLYPASMLNKLPCGKPEHVYNPNMDTFFGFVYCTINVPKNTPYPSLPVRNNGRVIFPTGTFTGMWFSEEIKYAISNGATILAAHWGIKFNANPNLFKDMIEMLNTIKVKASDPNNFNGAKREIAKLLMNSLYGRFGLRYLDEVTRIYDPGESSRIHRLFKVSRVIPFEDGQELIIHSRLPILDAIRIIEPNAEELDLLKTETNLYLNTNVALAAAITAYSRIKINEYKNHIHKLGGSVAYSDTDSIVCNIPLSEDMISGTKLGLMKLERQPIRAYFVAPKLYIQIYQDPERGEISLTKSRGYGAQLTEADFIQLYNGDDLILQKDKWFRLYGDHKVEIRNVEITFRSQHNKRVSIYDTSGKWVSTEAIHLTESIPIIQRTPTDSGKGSPLEFNRITDTIKFVSNSKDRQYQADITALNSQIDDLRSSMDILMESKYEDTKGEINILRSENASLKSQLSALNETISSLKATITAQNETISALNSKIDTLLQLVGGPASNGGSPPSSSGTNVEPSVGSRPSAIEAPTTNTSNVDVSGGTSTEANGSSDVESSTSNARLKATITSNDILILELLRRLGPGRYYPPIPCKSGDLEADINAQNQLIHKLRTLIKQRK